MTTVDGRKGGLFSVFRGRRSGPSEAPPPVSAEVAEQKPLKGVGVSDLPTDVDLVGVDPYVHGLANFIAGCPTPMTVAIQGGWGTGKTSTMKMVEKALPDQGDDCVIVRFNTWQYEHMDHGQGLTFHLVKAILAEVTPEAELGRAEGILHALWRGAKFVSAEAVEAAVRAADAAAAHAATVVGGEFGTKAYGAARESALEAYESVAGGADPINPVVDVRAEFAQVVMTRIKSTVSGSGRVVVFIDDLDRLEPSRAVEVMEALKALLDCAGCVFVLAVDFDVVQQGVRLKYPDMTNEKVRAFFDKIIQVPFHMPVSAYALDSVIRAGLSEADLADDVRERCCRIGVRAVDNNPRAAKRLINSFVMLRQVQKQTHKSRSSEPAPSGESTVQADMVHGDRQLFTFLALKAAFPEFAEEAESIPTDAAASLFSRAVDMSRSTPGDEDSAAELEAWGVASRDRERFADLLTHVIDAFEMKDGRGAGSFGRIATLTGVTSVGVPRLERATVLPTSERSDRMVARGIDPAMVDFARRIEEAVRSAFAARGLSVEGSENKSGTRWSFSVSGAGRSASRAGEVFFPAKGDSVQVVLPWRLSASAQDRARYEHDVRQLGDAHRWECLAKEGAGYIRVRGLHVDDDVAGLADMFVAGYDLGR